MSWPSGEPTESDRRLGLTLLFGLVAMGCAAQFLLGPRELTAAARASKARHLDQASVAPPRAEIARAQPRTVEPLSTVSRISRAGLAMPSPVPAASPAPAKVLPPPSSAPLSTAYVAPVKPSIVEILGPESVEEGETITFIVGAEYLHEAAQATIRLFYNPEALEFLSAEEGTLLSADGGVTLFLASTTALPGHVELVVSRLPRTGGVTSGGILCRVTFLAIGPGDSPLGIAGTRVLDARGREIPLSPQDWSVLVR